MTLYAQLETNEDWSHVGALMTDAASDDQHMLGRFVRRATRTRMTETGQIAVGPEHVRHKRERRARQFLRPKHRSLCWPRAISDSVYFLDWPERMTREQIEAAFPDLLGALASHEGIGFVMVRSAGGWSGCDRHPGHALAGQG